MRRNFWTSFGQYMRPLLSSEGGPVNWLNYKTGIKHFYFRMDADGDGAAIGIELTHPDPEQRYHYFSQLNQVKFLLEESTGEVWEWDFSTRDEHGKEVSRIYKNIKGPNIFKKEDWPQLISFLKPRMLALDSFWNIVRVRFD